MATTTIRQIAWHAHSPALYFLGAVTRSSTTACKAHRGSAVLPSLPTVPPPWVLRGTLLHHEVWMKTRSLLLVAVSLCALAPSAGAADWPQWRGPDRNDIA